MNDGYDAQKNAANLAKHGLDFSCISELKWDNAVTKQDDRYDYGEARYITLAKLDIRICTLV